MRADVRVAGDPNAVLEYLRTVEPFVLNGCATSGCHGGTGAGAFVLYRVPAGEATSYTNFYALNAYTVAVPDPAGGAFGGGNLTRRMIDRAKPDDSLLLNYMLPAARAKYAHPKVDGYVSVVEDPANANFQAVRNWIGSVLPKTGGPQAYGFEFDMAGGRPDDRTRRRRGVAATRGESWRSVLPTVSPTPHLCARRRPDVGRGDVVARDASPTLPAAEPVGGRARLCLSASTRRGAGEATRAEAPGHRCRGGARLRRVRVPGRRQRRVAAGRAGRLLARQRPPPPE